MVTTIYDLADEFSLQTNRCIFLTGKAGTGKTTFLRQLRNKTVKQVAVAAPTGVAAINAGGTTLHSLFQLPFTPFIPTDEARKNLISGVKMRADRRKVLYELELLVIDEVSMVRADVLDAVDTLLRHFKNRRSEPFGGVQVILIGDMFQLSPVVQESEWDILRNYYSGPYFFQSKVLEQLHPVYIELDTIFRQQNEEFIEILNQVRNNCLTPQNLDKLNLRYKPDYVNTDTDFHITLTTHNYKADKINADELAKIKSSVHKFKAKVDGEFNEKNYPTDAELELKVGARVMFVKNDEQYPRRFYNGKIGIIKSFVDNAIQIESEGETIELTKMVWKNVRYFTDDKTKQIQEEEMGTFTQYPLRLAWAITIHKSQGLTFDKAIIDAGQAFAAGQVYVALSRCRSLDGIVLLSRINTTSLRNADEILEYEKEKMSLTELEHTLYAAKNDFQTELFSSVFDYRGVLGQVERLIAFTKENVVQFNDAAISFLSDIKIQMENVQLVGSKFKLQLAQILMQTEQHEVLLQRMTAAAEYFEEKNGLLENSLLQPNIRTDVKALAKEMNDGLKNILGDLAQKNAFMSGLKTDATVERYFSIRKSFEVPKYKVDVFAGAVDEVTESTLYPNLLNKLFALRNRISREQHLPLYIVGNSNMLIEISNRLPRTEKELLQIKGFGKSKFIRFGQLFLDVINAYIVSNDMQVEPWVEPESAKPKEKRQKGDSQRITLALYREGKSMGQIADERQLAFSTIASHLYKFIQMGELDLNDFISEKKRNQALEIMRNTDSETDDKYALIDDLLTAEERTFFFCWLRSQ